MAHSLSEFHTARYCIHPYFGFVCTPNSVIDFSEGIVPPLGHPAIAHIDAWGFRNRDLPGQKPENETWIGLFGGSVAFSVASTSNETTVAGYLEAILNARSSGGKRIRIVNYALPAAQQPQTLLIFATKTALLDGAILFDGINEAIVPAYYNRGALPAEFPYRPIYEVLFARSVSEEQLALQWSIHEEEQALVARGPGLAALWRASRGRRRIKKLKHRLQELTSAGTPLESIFPHREASMEEYVDAGVDNWRACTRTMHALAGATGIEIISILQPMPERGKPLTERERQNIEAQPEVLAIRERAYAGLSASTAKLAAEGLTCLDFADVFAGRTEDLYVDVGHFSDQACQIAAEGIAGTAVGTWACVNGRSA